MNFCKWLTLALIVLKLCSVIELSWIWIILLFLLSLESKEEDNE